jgi:ABC-type nitrate/sulfonate/bicarbonate transport system substrate-binding protein
VTKLRFSLLRGVCQTPGYVALELGFLRDEGLDVEIHVAPTAWLIPHELATGRSRFAVLPWTRVAQSRFDESPLVVCAGSGVEEAAIVVRRGLEPEAVKSVVVPREGGIKDLTAMALIESLGWTHADVLRQPSGDGAIVSLFTHGADAASMVEPYATALEQLGVGTILRRTGDVWPGAPGCSLATTAACAEREPELVQAVVRAWARGVAFTRANPQETARVAHRYIGVAPQFIEAALKANAPDLDAVRNRAAMTQILSLMRDLGYLERVPDGVVDTRFLDALPASLDAPARGPA